MYEPSYLTLAALATVAVPELEVQAGCPPQTRDEDFIATSLLDEQSRKWTVVVPRHEKAQEQLNKQLKLLPMLANYHKAHRLAVAVSSVEGTAMTAAGFTAVVYPQLPGEPLDFTTLTYDSELLRALGKSIASFHELPTNLVEHAGFPVSSISAIRENLRANLQGAAATGEVPAELLARWTQALDEDAWWHFHPTFVHGSLSKDNILVADSRVLSVQDFATVHVGDPAQDLAWLVSEITPEAADTVFDAYHLGRAEGADSFLRQRVDLYLELALIDWLNWGVAQNKEAVITDAQTMLENLAYELREDNDGDLSMTGSPLLPTASTDTATVPIPATSPEENNV